MPFIIIGILLILVFYFISTYNFFQTTKARIKAAIQEIGNQLKRQANLIPNLEASVKGYMKQEKDIFQMLTDARKSVTAAVETGKDSHIEAASNKLQELLPRLQVVVESNPQLKSNEVVARLMDELRDTADKLMYARRTVIDLAADYNIKIATFPSNLVANLFGFKEEAGIATPTTGSHVEVSEEEMKDVKVNL
jgi:LemA protein